MKKVILFLVLAVACLRGAAQYTITPELGFNRSDFYTNASPTQISTSQISGFQVGGLLTRTWKNGIFLQTGLQFAQKGSYQGRGSQALYGSNTDVKLDYLQIPLNLGLRVKLYKDFGVMASAGLYLAYGISGTDKGTVYQIGGSGTIDRKVTFASDVTADNSKTYIRPFDNGYNLSAGFFYKQVEIKTVYSKGSPNVSPVGSTLYRNETWNFSIGYRIPVKLKK